MARTKNQRNTQRTTSSTPIMDPWDVEHQRSLAIHGPMANTNAIYPSAIHRGFDSQFEAKPLNRRYPVFEEIESHREFLVRSRSERLITTGERDNYYTPEQLWEEHDRIHEKLQFARRGEPSWVDEEPDSSDDEKEAEGSAVQQNAVARGQSEVKPRDGTDLPLEFHAEDHLTTITAVAPDHNDVQGFVAGLDLCPTAQLLAITSTSMNGTITVAFCGHGKARETVTEGAASNTPSISKGGSDEWNVALKDVRLPTVSLLSGAKNIHALLAATDWDTETTIATVVKYNDGRVVAILMGQQREKQHTTRRDSETEYGLLLNQFFQTVEKSTQHGAFTNEHKPLASLLEALRKDLVRADAIPDLEVAAQNQS